MFNFFKKQETTALDQTRCAWRILQIGGILRPNTVESDAKVFGDLWPSVVIHAKHLRNEDIQDYDVYLRLSKDPLHEWVFDLHELLSNGEAKVITRQVIGSSCSLNGIERAVDRMVEVCKREHMPSAQVRKYGLKPVYFPAEHNI